MFFNEKLATRHSRVGENPALKAGVSLVTVLLFMLVATIAATATYKWLTSEGRSSGSRLQQQEALQSSLAGIENARTWMTFHANDVGALIKAYLDDPARKPINLDARLRPLQKAGQAYHVWLTGVNTEKSTYKLKILSSGESRNGTRRSEIAIFNVDGLYQVKIPEEKVHSLVPFKHNYFGGSTQSQGTIKAHSLLINGDIHGSNPVYTDVDLIVTGDINITGSSVGAAGNVCVGGNLNANNGVLGGDFYVGGNATSFTFPTTSEAAHLSNANVTGNVYIEGNLGAPSTGDQKFQKNVTLNGIWTTNLGAHESQVAGNLCVGPDGQVLINSAGRTFMVGGNVWAESNLPIWWENGKDNQDSYDKIVLGNKAESEVYIKGGHPISDYVKLRNDRTFIEKNTYYRGTSSMAYGYGATARWDNKTTRPYKDLMPHMKTKNDAYYLYNYSGQGQDVDYIVTSTPWGWGGRIDYASYYVGNHVFYTPAYGFPGFYGYSAEVINTLNYDGTVRGTPYCKATPDKWRPECAVTPWFKSKGVVSRTFPETREFQCAEMAKAHCDSIWTSAPGAGCPKKDGTKSNYIVPDILVTAYQKFEKFANKGCNVTEWNSNLSKGLNACYQSNSTDAQKYKENLYNGYQVVKVEDKGKSDPTTPLKGKFIIIVTNKMGQQSLPPTTADSYAFVYLTQGGTSTIQPAADNGIYNYFIYTKHDINGVMFNNSDFSGSIYAAVTPNCAKVGDFKSRNMVLNEELLSDLSENGVICDGTVAEGSCGGTELSSASGETSTASSITGGTDSYYISMAPQLGVHLESQYKNDEQLPSANEQAELSPSFIVLPRVIYLPSDPYGNLTDYYNVQPLNGSSLSKSNVTVTCSGSGALPTTGHLYSSTPLSKGIYSCSAAASGYSNVPFWVVVGDGSRGTPSISFEEPSSTEMNSNDTKEIKLVVPAHAATLEVNIYCPDADNEAWSYESLGSGVTRDGSSCKLVLAASDVPTSPTVFTIKTTNAVTGTMTFQLLPGEGYIPGTPASKQLYISASSILNRIDATSGDIEAYCNANSGVCPEGYATYWPDCDVSGVWVEPAPGVSFSNLIANTSWVIMVGGTGTITLAEATGNSDDCVVIIPESDNSIVASTVEANKSYNLRASAKAKQSSFKVGFKGEVGDGKHPVINISAGGRNSTCEYENATVDSETSARTCTVDVFKGELVTVLLDSTTSGGDDVKNFSYWRCSGTSCPSTETVTSKNYGSFSVSENGSVLLAHFGEADKHCFFDEFKRNSVACDDEETQYCIDKCSENDPYSTCTGVVDANGEFTNAKWHLISGELAQIVVGYDGEIHIDKSAVKKKKDSYRNPVIVMSTVNAGILGTLKALINVPRATSSYDNSAANIKNSGFMLRANAYGNDYFMLNLYENNDGYLEAQLWKGATSLTSVLTNNDGARVSVSNSRMVMVTANVTAAGTIEVRANVDNFYGDASGALPPEYGCDFELSEFNSTLADAAHEYVGFSLADPNFKIYGIGWKSATYNSECYDAYPTVKCSFAAVATDGVVKTGVDVEPWVGHSGWFDSKGCSPLYYYNGDDACSGGTCGKYNFAESGIGAHGYTDNNGNEVKTAKAWLGNCLYANSTTAVAWSAGATTELAHCGAFWTGKFTECSAHQPSLFSGSQSVAYGMEETFTFTSKQNLRAATLHITLENADNNEVEIWLVSESDNWGDNDHESHSVKMNGTSGNFDVMKEFASGSNGFDPENVKQVVVKNHGATSVTVTSIASTCANAIGITYCRADFDGSKWNVVTQVTNKNLISSERIVATVDGSGKHDVTKNANGDEGIVWNGDAAYVSIADPDVYTYQGKSYVFTATITGTTSQTDSKTCSVSPDPIGTIGVDCSVVGSIASGARFPTFNVNFNGCPSGGCSYAIYLDDATTPFATGTDPGSARHAANQSETCTTAGGCSHTYTVKSTSTSAPFDDCSASFKVLRDSENAPPTVTCGISTNQWNFTSGNAYTTDHLYFIAKNAVSEDKTYSAQLKLGNDNVGSAATLKNWSQMTLIQDLGSLTAGSHTYALYVSGEKVCEETITVEASTATCKIYDNNNNEITTAFTTTNNLKFTVTSGVRTDTKGGFSGTVLEWKDGVATDVVKDNAEFWMHANQNDVWQFTAPQVAGTYTYSVSVKGNELCHADLTVADALSCSAPETVNPGQTFTLTGTYYGSTCYKGWTNGIETNQWPGDLPCNGLSQSFTAPTTAGTYHYKIGVDGAPNAQCTRTVKVQQGKPAFSCADNLKATVDTDNNVKLRLSGITGCDGDGCSYSISGIGSTATTYTGCKNTSCNLSTITNKTTTAGNTATYAISLTNGKGTTTQDCSVEFEEPSGCNCTCSSGCENLITGTIAGSNDAVKCFFGTRIFDINEHEDRYPIMVNGKRPKYCEGVSNCNNALSNSAVDVIDGGYYVEMPVASEWIKVSVGGASTPVCGSTTIIVVGSGTSDDPYDDGSITNSGHRVPYEQDKWYTVSVIKDGGGKFVIQNHTGTEATLTYMACGGTQKTATVKKGQEGNDGDGWWNRIEDSLPKDCAIVFKFSVEGQYDLQVW